MGCKMGTSHDKINRGQLYAVGYQVCCAQRDLQLVSLMMQ